MPTKAEIEAALDACIDDNRCLQAEIDGLNAAQTVSDQQLVEVTADLAEVNGKLVSTRMDLAESQAQLLAAQENIGLDEPVDPEDDSPPEPRQRKRRRRPKNVGSGTTTETAEEKSERQSEKIADLERQLTRANEKISELKQKISDMPTDAVRAIEERDTARRQLSECEEKVRRLEIRVSETLDAYTAANRSARQAGETARMAVAARVASDQLLRRNGIQPPK